ncbi:cupin [Mesorhizobium sp. BR1-1-16]|uniref:cupin n=1 Tax=Mesorhizobium sp. BR1-1-16 TaxID=2876653 RepID=UPI001CC92C80|nr:cupin [Mesorhizobium sp. BR1-1-16]MBZ9937902.1 cupin [Mesorhizobium sp. BR1-1-16]
MLIEPLMLADDGATPNHPGWPLLAYRGALTAEALAQDDHAFDRLFEANGWPVGFRNGIYSFTHFHSVTHEVLGIARGRAEVQFGGDSGPIVTVAAGDAALLPAGTGHKLIEASGDLLVVGAYPPDADYDLVRAGEGDGPTLRKRIAAVPRPDTDPVLREAGGLGRLWLLA